MRLLRDSSVVCRTSRYALPMINMHPLDEDWCGARSQGGWSGMGACSLELGAMVLSAVWGRLV